MAMPLSTRKKVKLIDNRAFAAVAQNKKAKIFLMNMAILPVAFI